jgi:hypothetical protein
MLLQQEKTDLNSEPRKDPGKENRWLRVADGRCGLAGSRFIGIGLGHGDEKYANTQAQTRGRVCSNYRITAVSRGPKSIREDGAHAQKGLGPFDQQHEIALADTI